jgi:hypothetical protein
MAWLGWIPNERAIQRSEPKQRRKKKDQKSKTKQSQFLSYRKELRTLCLERTKLCDALLSEEKARHRGDSREHQGF